MKWLRLSFHDINPQKIHVLVIPKGEYKDLDDFTANVDKEIVEFNKATYVSNLVGAKEFI